MNEKSINIFIKKYKDIVDELDNTYHYPNNAKYLLYVMLVGFIVKYGIEYEDIIIDTFKEIQIVVNRNNNDGALVAVLEKKILFDEEKKPYTRKKIVLNDYKNVPIINLLDSLIHEYNHAINSHLRELIIKKEKIIVRSGISYSTYFKNYLFNSKNVYLEEVINTKQVVEIINIINSFNNYEITDEIILNTLYAVKQELSDDNYTSNSYYLQSAICKNLLNNKTFNNTINQLRFSGHLEDIDFWFDSITNQDNSFKILSTTLDKIHHEQQNLDKIKLKFLKKRKIKLIKNLSQTVLNIVNEFNNNA